MFVYIKLYKYYFSFLLLKRQYLSQLFELSNIKYTFQTKKKGGNQPLYDYTKIHI